MSQRGSNLSFSRQQCAEALALYKALGDEAGAGNVADHLGIFAFEEGDMERALHYGEYALQVRREGSTASAIARSHIAVYSIALGELDRGKKDASELLRWARQNEDALYMAVSVQILAYLAALRGQVRDAARLRGYSDFQRRDIGFATRLGPDKWAFEQLDSTLRQHLNDQEIEGFAAEGAAWSEDQAVEEALKV